MRDVTHSKKLDIPQSKRDQENTGYQRVKIHIYRLFPSVDGARARLMDSWNCL